MLARSWFTRGSYAILVVGGLLTFGCEPNTGVQTPSSGSGSTKTAESTDPRAILDAMAAAYREAKTYEDTAELIVEDDVNGKRQIVERFRFGVGFERPNRVRIEAFRTSLVSDGKLLRATTADLENQILSLPAPPQFEFSNLLGDKLLAESIQGGIDATLPQLKLLTGDESLPGFNNNDKLTLIDDAKLGDETCQRVKAENKSGVTTYWIEPKTHLLRRMEFPTDAIIKQQGAAAKGLKIWADFTAGRFNTKIDPKAFAFESPPAAQLVRRFLLPPPQPPSPLVGQPAGEFTFDSLDGSTVDRAALQGKVAVIDFWGSWGDPRFNDLSLLQKVYEHYKNNDKVAVLAVSTDAADIDDAIIKKFVTELKLALPIARDRKQHFQSTFQTKVLPMVIVLDANGVVQDIATGYNPKLAEELPKKIDRLLAGESLANETLAKHETDRTAYERELNEVLVGTTATVEVPRTEIAKSSQPSNLKLTSLWTAEDVPAPGNLLVIGAGSDRAEIYVLSGSQGIFKVDAAGKVEKSYPLEIPKTVGVSYLRTAVDGAGKRHFAVFAATLQQFYLFNADWKLELTYPDSQNPGISDVQLADLDGDGQIEILVSYLGVLGVQGVSLSGERLWSNRSAENVTRLAVTAPNADQHREVLCANTRDMLSRFDDHGKSLAALRIPDQAVYTLEASDFDGQSPRAICALSLNEASATTALGLDETGKILWTYPLPLGVHALPIELVTPGLLPGNSGGITGVWLLPGPDGSIHIVSTAGKLIDKFNTGEELTGVATATIDGNPAILISTTKGLTAWKVE